MRLSSEKYIFGLMRIGLGWIFFWAFIDKAFGLSFATSPDKAWIAGGSPTLGFLKFATKGPFASFYQSIAGTPIVDWLFMLGLLGVGVALILGIGVRIASYSGALMMLLMYTAVLPPENNPLLDDHIIYLLVLLGINITDAGRYLGFGNVWSETQLVKKYPYLK